MRDRAAALTQALRRQRRFESLRQAGRVVIELAGWGGAELSGGRLLQSWASDGQAPLPWRACDPQATSPTQPTLAAVPSWCSAPPDRSEADELACVATWLDREAHRVRIVHADGGLASPYPVLPTFEAGRARPMAGRRR